MKIIQLPKILDQRGNLSFLEGNKHIPFEIKRIFYVHSVPAGVVRGGHAHKFLDQLLICPYGSIEIVLDDGLNEKEKVILNKPTFGLHIPGGVWKDMIWNVKNSILCVAASDYYNADDYIRDYETFKKMAVSGYWSK